MKMKNWINILLGAILGLLGFGCAGPVKYGVPSANLTVEGQVTNEEHEALPNMQVVRRGGWKGDPEIESVTWEDDPDTLYTNGDGQYYKEYRAIVPVEYYKIIVNDTAGGYMPDSVITTVDFSGGDGEWDQGSGYLKADFVLKKK